MNTAAVCCTLSLSETLWHFTHLTSSPELYSSQPTAKRRQPRTQPSLHAPLSAAATCTTCAAIHPTELVLV